MRRLYALLLLLYPAAFRRRYRSELIADCERDARDPRHAGLFGRIHFGCFLLADLIASAARQRAADVRRRIRRLRGRGEPQLPTQPGRGFMDTLLQDVRYAIRQFVRRPGFAAVAVLSLALAIGGNTLIFGLLDGFVFHPFPYPDPDRFVSVGATFPRVSSDTTYVEALSPAEYEDIKRSTSFSRLAAFDLGNRNVSGGDVPERVFTALLLDDLFPVIGMGPRSGAASATPS